MAAPASRISLCRTVKVSLMMFTAARRISAAHSAGFNMAFADGHVMLVPYNIDPIVHMQLGNRADGEPTDQSWTGAR